MDKILVYLDHRFIHYAITKYLQSNYECKLFGIVDLNPSPQKFYKNQNTVNFKKLWYYRDHPSITKKNPNLEYLQNFEKEYRINLWQICYFERKFYPKYNMYYKFSEEEILSILEQTCRFFESIINEINPDFLLISAPDWHHMELLVQLCKSKGIHVLMLDLAKFGNRVRIDDGFLNDEDNQSSNTENTNFEELQKFLEKASRSDQIKKVKKNMFVSLKKIFGSLFEIIKTTNSDEYRKHYTNFGKTPFKVFLKDFAFQLKIRKRENFIKKNFTHEINNEPFIFFPLHLEPERVLLIDSPFYTNQIVVIENIAKSLPIDYWLYVKEHPAMKTLGWREIDFYKQIMEIPNVKLISPEIESKELIKKCSLLISITGTAAIESLFYGKPSMIFSKIWGHSHLPSIIKIETIEDLPAIIRRSLKTKIQPKELQNYLRWLEKNSIEFDYNDYMIDLWHELYRGGVLVNVEIPQSKVDKLIKKYKVQLDNLSKWHIDRIKSFRSQFLES